MTVVCHLGREFIIVATATRGVSEQLQSPPRLRARVVKSQTTQ